MKRICYILLSLLLSALAYGQGTVQIGAGTQVQASAGVYLVARNANLVNNGTLQQGTSPGVYKVAGNSTVSVSGSGTTSFGQLQLGLGSAYQLNLQANATAVSGITFSSGLLNLGNASIDLGTTGSLSGETETTHAFTSGTGFISATANLNAPSAVNPGNLGAIISSPANLGITTIRRGHQVQTSSGGGTSIYRYYDINATNSTGLNATLALTYLDAELNGLDESSLTLWRSTNSGVTWSYVGADSRNTATNYVEKTGINDFSRWTLSPYLVALPVSYTLFNVHCASEGVKISWQAEEVQARSYTIEKSTDGTTWMAVAAIGAAGQGTHSYTYLDPAPAGGPYYRIGAQDASGRTSYTRIIAASCARAETFSVYPNPVGSGPVNINLYTAADAVVRLALYDAKGALVQLRQLWALAGNNLLELPTGRLSDGIYTLVVSWNGMTRAVKLIKKD